MSVQKMTTLAFFTTLSLAIFAIESAIPPLVPIPGIKLGLANIITLILLAHFTFRDALWVLLARILLSTLLFGQAGIDAEAVTTDGGAKSLLSLAGGNVACAIATSTVGAQYVEEGTLVPVLVFSDEPFTRYDGFEVPTAKSLGYDIVFQTCNFLMTRKDANPDDVAAICQAILDYSETEEFKELAANASYVPDLADGETIRQIIADTASMCQSAYETYYAK